MTVRQTSRRPSLAGLVAVLLAIGLAVSGALPLALPAGASELSPEEAEAVEASETVEPTGERIEVPDGFRRGDDAAIGSWVWPEGRRLFLLGKLDDEAIQNPAAAPNDDEQGQEPYETLLGRLLDGGAANRRMGYKQLVALDLDSGVEVGRVELDPAGFSGAPMKAGLDRPQESGSFALGQQRTAVVDRQGGRLFVAYGQNPLEAVRVGGNGVSGCASRLPCVGGVHVLDAATLEPRGQIGLQVARADGGVAAPYLLAMRHVPAVDGQGDKVLLVVEDVAHQPAPGHDQAFGAGTGAWTTRGLVPGQVYVVQLDVESRAQEWAVRVNSCQGARETRDDPQFYADRVYAPGPATVVRAADASAVWAGCYAPGASRTAVVNRIPLDAEGFPAQLPVEPADPQQGLEESSAGGLAAEPRQEQIARRPEGQASWQGPDETFTFLSDPVSGRILLRSRATGDEMWWVFDTARRGFIGAVGIGEYGPRETRVGLDELRGRLYVQVDDRMYVADVRGDPLGQAVVVAGGGRGSLGWTSNRRAVARMFVVDGTEGRDDVRLLGAMDENMSSFGVLVDRIPARAQGIAAEDRFAGRTLDIPEAEGVTEATFDGTARGYGARAILVGGLEAAARVGPIDATNLYTPHGGTSQMSKTYGMVWPEGYGCVQDNRELAAAFVGPQGPATVDAGGARGAAQPLVIDGSAQTDLTAPVSRCTSVEWDELWQQALFSRPPLSEPSAPWVFEGSRAECVSDDDSPEGSWADPYAGVFTAEVVCGDREASGRSEASGMELHRLAEGDVDPGDLPDDPSELEVSVTEALSHFRIYLDEQRGLVARVESVARGVSIGPLIQVDTIRGSAESWANGRAQPGSLDAHEEDATAFNAYNCDMERTAGTCFVRHLFGVHIGDGQGGTAYQCGPCGDEHAAVAAIDAALGTNGQARLRDPDPLLARGAPNGYQAAIVKPEAERFADLMLNADQLQTTVPTLEVIRFAAPTRQSVLNLAGNAPRPIPGRQVYQFAGVEVSTGYGIQCLLEYDPATNVCAEPAVPASSLTVELIDLDGVPLAGGAFELRRDTDGDGVLGLVDELVENGACATGPEGVCAFTGLEPGAYLVSQTAAPDGYAPVDEALAVSLFGGDDLTVTFTNVPNVSTIALTVTDLDGNPVEGAVFGVFPDADHFATASASATASPGDVEPVATCTTEADGVCSMTVPPGAYVLRQLSAPDGLLPIDDIAFVISQAGQTADVALTLGTAGTDPAPVTEPAAGPVEDFGPAPVAQPAVSITPAPVRPAPSVTATPPTIAEPPAVAEQVGGTIVRVIRSPAGALRLAARSPVEAASLVMVLLLVGLAVMAVARRQQLATLLAVPAAYRGGHGPDGPGRPVPPHRGPGGGPGSAPTAHAFVRAPTALRERKGMVRPIPAGGANTLRVVVAAADEEMAQRVAAELVTDGDLQVVGTAASIGELRQVSARTDPHVIVIDLSLRNGDLWEQLNDLHEPGRTIGLINARRSLRATAARGLRHGLASLMAVDGDLGTGQLPAIARCVAVGKAFDGATVQAIYREQQARELDQVLSGRLLEVARLSAEGLKRSQIADHFAVSPQTVKIQLRLAREKLGVADPHNRRELHDRLVEAGLVAEPDDHASGDDTTVAG